MLPFPGTEFCYRSQTKTTPSLESYPILTTEIMVRLDVGGTPLHTSLATVMKGARQGSDVFQRLCTQVGSRKAPSASLFAQPPYPPFHKEPHNSGMRYRPTVGSYVRGRLLMLEVPLSALRTKKVGRRYTQRIRGGEGLKGPASSNQQNQQDPAAL